MTNIPQPTPLPGKGLFGWLGRQVGYVKRAAQFDAQSKKLYQSRKIEEQLHPDDPNITLRRTTIDEVIEQRKPS